MSALSLLAELYSRGVRLELVGDRISYEASPGMFDPDLRARFGRQRDEILKVLASPRKALSEEWERTLKEVSALWNVHKARYGDAPWLSEEEDDALQAEVGEAIRNEDLERGLSLMARWKKAWEGLLSADEARQQRTSADTTRQEQPRGTSLADTFDDSPGAPSVIRMFEEAEKHYKRIRGETW